jgi:phage shock protein A
LNKLNQETKIQIEYIKSLEEEKRILSKKITDLDLELKDIKSECAQALIGKE